MNRSRFHLIAFGFVLVALAVVLIASPRQTAAQPVPAVIDGPAVPGQPDPKDPKAQDKVQFPVNRDTSLKFEAIGDYLKQKNPDKWATVCDLSQKLLDAKSDYFYQYEEGDKRRVSVKHEVEQIIGKLPEEGLQFYQLRFGPTAEEMLKQAKEGGFDRTKLSEVSQRYFHTKPGGEATLILAGMHLDAGNYPEAAYLYARLLGRPAADKLMDAKSLFKAAVAFRRTGDVGQREKASEVWAKLEKDFPRTGVQIGRKGYTLDTLKAEFDRQVDMTYGGVSGQLVAMKGGDATRAVLADAGTPFLGPQMTSSMLYNNIENDDGKTAADWLKQAIDKAYKDSVTNTTAKRTLIPAGFPVTAPNMIIYRGYDGTYAYYTKACVGADGKPHAAGELAWISPCNAGALSVLTDAASSTQGAGGSLKAWWSTFWSTQMPSVLFENPIAGTLSHDGKYVYFVDDLNVPPATQGFNDYGQFIMPGSGEGPRVGFKDYNRLKAVDLESGQLAWTLGDIGSAVLKGDEDDKAANAFELTDGGFFLGAPMVVNGKLYVVFERDGYLKMACLDPYKTKVVAPPVGGAKPKAARTPCPEVLWVQSLGRPNRTVRQDAFRRIQGVFPAAADGVVICPTNSGAVVAVDLNARSLLWAHTYSTAAKGPEVGGGGGMGFRGGWAGEGGIPGAQISSARWRSSTPIIANGRVILTAYDSDHIQCLDLRSGKLLWTEARRADDLYVGGVMNDTVIVVGRTYVRGVKLTGDTDEKTGKEKVKSAWKSDLKIGTPVGHGVCGKNGTFYLPVVGDPDKKDDRNPAVWAVNATTGTATGKTPYRRKELGANGAATDSRLSLGNLVFHDGLMYSQSATEVSAFPLIEVKQREMDELLAKNPNDPEGLFSRGELRLEDGKLQDAITDLKKAEANKPNEPLVKKIQNKLYVAYTEVMRNDFAAAEGFLQEYKGLCEFPITAEVGTPDHVREVDEQIRRRGLFYCLVAEGREKQGRLVEAFDHYRSYAELGEQGKLLPVPEDPNTLALSGVWASGRIDAMMRNVKDPAVRKPLDDKVTKEWDDVRGANDLDRLRKFVRVFGPYFAPGLEAQFLLAERLSATNNDDDRREAQAYLLNLLRRAEEDKTGGTAARATDALARLLTSRGLMDDAVGLYARLGLRYPTVAVRGDKTGGDVYADLVTDKRYLPYLEPPRGPTFTRYAVKAENASGANSTSGITYAPAGEQLPYFSRNRVALVMDQNSGMTTLRVTDRITGEEKFKAGNLPNMFNQFGYGGNSASIHNQPLVQASGHLLLVHLNQFVTCYDLTKGKDAELWKVNLFGPNMTNVQMQMDYNNTDGDFIVCQADNNTGQMFWGFRMGKSAVLQSTYACVITRDGLIAKDPRTGTTLWTRTTLANRSAVFGDSRHIYLLEPTGNGGMSSKVLRAVDGVQVDGVPDFGKLLTSPNKLHQLGRQVLLFEPGKDKTKVLRLYDILDGKDVWSKDCPADSVALDAGDPEMTGFVTADGKIEVVNSLTGKSILSAAVDKEQLKAHTCDDKGKFNLTRSLVLADGERVYVFLNKPYKNNNGMTPENYVGMSPLRVKSVNGVAYAFDRGTGQRLWYADGHFLNQRVYVDHLDTVPCLIAANPYFMADGSNPGGQGGMVFLGGGGPGGGPVFVGGGPGGGGVSHVVTVVDKKTGKLKVQKGFPQNGWMQFMNIDTKANKVEMGTYNMKLTIQPEEAKK